MKLLDKEKFIDILPKINMLLFIGVIALTIYLSFILLRPHQPLALDREVQIGMSKLLDEEAVISVEDIPAFQESVFKERALFNISSEKEPQREVAAFQLLGLVSVGEKNAAMIRDTKENKNYYLLEGETIGEYRVKQILEDMVILESEGKTLEIGR